MNEQTCKRRIGVDIGGTNIKGVLLEDRKILGRVSCPTPSGIPGRTAKAVCELAERLSGTDTRLPIGIACAGEIDENGVITAENLGWDKVDFVSELRKAGLSDFTLYQDAYAASEAEYRAGALRDTPNAVYLCIGTGIGGNVFLGGRSLRKLSKNSCELGHMSIHADGRRCSCGNKGCFEEYASAGALSRMSGSRYSAAEIVRMAQEGDAAMLSLWESYLGELAVGVMNCLILYAPSAVCIGGGMSLSGEFLLAGLRRKLEQFPYFNNCFLTVRLLTAAFAGEAGAVGAALLTEDEGS